MDMSGLPYPIFKVNEDVDAWEKFLPRAVSQINPRYFDKNPRFKRESQVSKAVLLGYSSIYEEGDWWALTIIELTIKNGIHKYVFLPLTAQNAHAKLAQNNSGLTGLDSVAFGLETKSGFFGKRSKKIVDAFSDISFCIKLIQLFSTQKDKLEEDVNAYTVIHDGGTGQFTFQALKNLQPEWDARQGISMEFNEWGDLLLKYGDVYRLTIHQALPFTVGSGDTQELKSPLGQIAYRGMDALELLIGTLERTTRSEN